MKWLPWAAPAWGPWVTQHCWWPWPLAGLLGTKRSLAPCGELQEIHFSLWFPALEPDKTAQPVATFRKRAQFVQALEAGRGCRQCQESFVSPVLLPVLTGGTVPLRSCCLILLAFQPLACPVALLFQLLE